MTGVHKDDRVGMLLVTNGDRMMVEEDDGGDGDIGIGIDIGIVEED